MTDSELFVNKNLSVEQTDVMPIRLTSATPTLIWPAMPSGISSAMPSNVSYGTIKVGNRAGASATKTRPREPSAQSLRIGSATCGRFEITQFDFRHFSAYPASRLLRQNRCGAGERICPTSKTIGLFARVLTLTGSPCCSDSETRIAVDAVSFSTRHHQR